MPLSRLSLAACYGASLLLAAAALTRLLPGIRRLIAGRTRPVFDVVFFAGADAQRPPCFETARRLVRRPLQLRAGRRRRSFAAICQSVGGGDSCRMSHDSSHPYFALIGQLAEARRSLSVCLYAFSGVELAELLIQLRKQAGVLVRIIVDCEQRHASGCVLDRLLAGGVEAVTDDSSYFMHHKFVIIDNSLVITGSMNWTRQAAVGNWENLVTIDREETVAKFRDEFERLWRQFGGERKKAAATPPDAVV